MGILSLNAGGLFQRHSSQLKSTQEKMQRRQKADGQVAYWENKKAGLKNRECATVEEIAKKLEMFHTYEDEIASAKAAYNNEQMFHVLDEAMEQGERNAKAIEKTKPKTPEERAKEMAEEALGIDEEKGILSEALDEVMEKAMEAAEEIGQIPRAALAAEGNPAGDAAAEEAEDIAQAYKRFDMRI